MGQTLASSCKTIVTKLNHTLNETFQHTKLIVVDVKQLHCVM